MALLMASRSSVLPSALAPNVLTSKVAARAPRENARAAQHTRKAFDIPSPLVERLPLFITPLRVPRLHLAAVGLRNMRVRQRRATAGREVLDVLQHDGRNARGLLRFHVLEVDAVDLVEDEGRPAVFLHESNLHVVQLDALGVADEEIGRAACRER